METFKLIELILNPELYIAMAIVFFFTFAIFLFFWILVLIVVRMAGKHRRKFRKR